MKFSLKKIVTVFAICFVVIPTSALSHSDSFVSLFFEQLEQPYSNSWDGMLISSDSGQTDAYIKGEGKSVEFHGILSINCSDGSGHYWKAASIWDEPATASQLKQTVPPDVTTNARKEFCR